MTPLSPINECEIAPSSCVQPMVSPGQCLLCLLLLHFVSGRYKVLFDSTWMLPMKEAEDDMMRTISTGKIPDQLLQDILKEAGQFMDLFKHNPSSFLTRLAEFKALMYPIYIIFVCVIPSLCPPPFESLKLFKFSTKLPPPSEIWCL